MAIAGRPSGVGYLPGGEIRAADIADLAGAYEVIEGAESLVYRGRGIKLMLLVKVYPGGAQPRETILHGADDVAAGCAGAAVVVGHFHAEFGGEHDIVPAAAEDLAEKFLRRTVMAGALRAIDVSRVEQGDSRVQRRMDNGAGGFEADASAEIITAEADRGDAQAGAAQITLFDGSLSLAGAVGEGGDLREEFADHSLTKAMEVVDL